MNDAASLAELLMETGHRHHHAYQDSDGVDPEWALWYAGYMQSRIWDAFGTVPTRSRIVHLLLAAEEAHAAAGDEAGEWAPFYGAYLVEQLS